ncbi:MAPEG family protein [Gammaproteobacteria bacterium]|nr:MAPEG family protein [Gammaproteobacteria bacterium]
MIDIIILTLLLVLIQVWLFPMLLNLKNLDFLLSNRNQPVTGIVMLERVNRASANLQESLPAFLALALLAMHLQLDLVSVASVWLALRGAYFALYAFGITHIRSVVWIASVACLINMAMVIIGIL